jgi:DNA-binding NarL/FixJ family response regulator
LPHYETIKVVTAGDLPLRILIADPDPFFRRGTREILNEQDGLRVVAEAADGEQAVLRTQELRPDGLDLVLLELDLPRLDGIAATERLSAADGALPIVILTGSADEGHAQAAFRAGAVGFLTKSLPPDGLVHALLAFSRGASLPILPSLAEPFFRRLRAPGGAEASDARLPSLTAREREVFELIAAGARDRDIAQRLVVSESTIKKHVQNILRKLHARNRAQAIARLRNA